MLYSFREINTTKWSNSMSEKVYQVTARKWRPQIYEDVIGQEHVAQTLKNSIKAGKVAHAFIFSGPRGIGKTSMARILAKSLNCPQQDDFNPCNQCETCNSISRGTNIDIIEIDGASNRRIDEIRTLRESVKYAPSTVKYKTYIIDEVHMLTNESFNALLKTLEEPPPHVIFIFATTDIHKVPSTILSRCQRYDFRRLTMNEIKNHLAKIAQFENVEYDDDALSIIAKKADGAMRDAQSIFDQIIAYSNSKVTFDEVSKILNAINQDIYFRVTDAVIQKNLTEGFNISNEVYYNGWDLVTFLNGLIEHFRNILTVNIINDPSFIEASENIKEKYLSVANNFSSKDTLRSLSLLTNSIGEIKQSPNQKLSLEIILSQLIELPNSADIESLIQQIKSLKGNSGSKLISNDTQRQQSTLNLQSPAHSIKHKTEEEQPKLELYDSKKNIELNNEVKVVSENINANYDVTSIEEIKNKWKSFIELIKNDRSLIGTSLEKTLLESSEKNQLNLICDNPEQVSIIESFKDYLWQQSQKHFGRPFRFNVRKNFSNQVTVNEKMNTSAANNSSSNVYDFIINELNGEKISE